MALFRSKNTDKTTKKVKIKPLSYHPKIILAWAKAIEGNTDLMDFLYHNGYKELTFATHAIRREARSRDWLMQNGYPHLVAMVTAYEGSKEAAEWLKNNNFILLYNMALAIRDEDHGLEWMKKNSSPEFYILTDSIRKVKLEREDDDYYRVNKKRIGLDDHHD